MTKAHSDKFATASKAAGMTPEKFADALCGLLSRGKCRNTKQIFSARVLKEIQTRG